MIIIKKKKASQNDTAMSRSQIFNYLERHTNANLQKKQAYSSGLLKSKAYKLNFGEINAKAQGCFYTLVRNWLPIGEIRGEEWVALNPTRVDRHLGSFRVNPKTGQFYDFATGEGGAGAIALYSYINKLEYKEAASAVAKILEVSND